MNSELVSLLLIFNHTWCPTRYKNERYIEKIGEGLEVKKENV